MNHRGPSGSPVNGSTCRTPSAPIPVRRSQSARASSAVRGTAAADPGPLPADEAPGRPDRPGAGGGLVVPAVEEVEDLPVTERAAGGRAVAQPLPQQSPHLIDEPAPPHPVHPL